VLREILAYKNQKSNPEIAKLFNLTSGLLYYYLIDDTILKFVLLALQKQEQIQQPGQC
jgi:hypothetical protein